MAAYICPNCSHPFSDSDISCPKCGYRTIPCHKAPHDPLASSFEIIGDRLIRYRTGSGRISKHRVRIPAGVTRIEAKAFSGRRYSICVEIPPCVTYIHEEAFCNVDHVTVFGVPGSYAHRYALSKAGSPVKFTFCPDDTPPQLRLGPHNAPRDYSTIRADIRDYAPAVREAMMFELPCEPVMSYYFPITLFDVETVSKDHHERYLSYNVTDCVYIQMERPGELVCVTDSCMRDLYKDRERSSTSSSPITFEELPEYIRRANNNSAGKYLGMTALNWSEYLRPYERIPLRPSKYPVIRFGSYMTGEAGDSKEPIEWFVLDQQDGHLLLLSRKGLDVCQYFPATSKDQRPDWNASYLRQWLNERFYPTAFSEEERRFIKQGPQDPPVFCLSIDTNDYGKYLAHDPVAVVQPTDYARMKGCRDHWWLKSDSSVYSPNNWPMAWCVTDKGEAERIGINFWDVCVRPAVLVCAEYWTSGQASATRKR